MNSYVMFLFVSISIYAADDALSVSKFSLSSTSLFSERRLGFLSADIDFPDTPVNTPHHSPEISPNVSPVGSPSNLRRNMQAHSVNVEDHALLQEIEEDRQENTFWEVVSFCAILVSMYYYHVN